tara:strand:+ start:364 stop:1104 length:741 start_codon:yes stop_codon:yes gene_type:complete
MSAIYCSEQDVAAFLQVPNFSGSTTPAQATVVSFIEMAQERINQLTDHAWNADTTTRGEVTEERVRIQRVDQGSVDVRGRLQLRHFPILALDNGQGDIMSIWESSSYVDYLHPSSGKTGSGGPTDIVGKDYWQDTTRGIIYINNYHAINNLLDSPSDVDAYVTYRYASANTPADIKLATIYFTAATIVMNDDLNLMAEGDDSMDNAAKSQKFEDMAMKILKDNRRLDRKFTMSRSIGGFGVGRSTL